MTRTVCLWTKMRTVLFICNAIKRQMRRKAKTKAMLMLPWTYLLYRYGDQNFLTRDVLARIGTRGADQAGGEHLFNQKRRFSFSFLYFFLATWYDFAQRHQILHQTASNSKLKRHEIHAAFYLQPFRKWFCFCILNHIVLRYNMFAQKNFHFFDFHSHSKKEERLLSLFFAYIS